MKLASRPQHSASILDLVHSPQSTRFLRFGSCKVSLPHVFYELPSMQFCPFSAVGATSSQDSDRTAFGSFGSPVAGKVQVCQAQNRCTLHHFTVTLHHFTVTLQSSLSRFFTNWEGHPKEFERNPWLRIVQPRKTENFGQDFCVCHEYGADPAQLAKLGPIGFVWLRQGMDRYGNSISRCPVSS